METKEQLIWVDAHCHLSDPRFETELSKIIQRAYDKNIKFFLMGGYDPLDWERQKKIKNQYPNSIFPVFGLHPWWVSMQTEKACFEALDQLNTALNQAGAIGELGLDLSPKMDPQSFQLQKKIFEEQLRLGYEKKLPVVLHLVKAHPEALEVLKSKKITNGIVHGFTGSWEIAQSYLHLGLSLSIGTSVLKKGYETLKRAVSRIPLEQMVLETDSPDGSWNQELNEPSNLILIAEKIGELKKVSPEKILETSASNLERIFKWKAILNHSI